MLVARDLCAREDANISTYSIMFCVVFQLTINTDGAHIAPNTPHVP